VGDRATTPIASTAPKTAGQGDRRRRQPGRHAGRAHRLCPAGGRINTDFIDNSAGVDCSDNEVNIKIALNADVAAGKLGMKARNTLLASMTDNVAAIVLEDNRLQTLTLSIAQRDGADNLPAHIRLIETFEAAGQLDRAVEGIASNDELNRRATDRQGLTRPELAVLLSMDGEKPLAPSRHFLTQWSKSTSRRFWRTGCARKSSRPSLQTG
jgi:hypothetical protein